MHRTAPRRLSAIVVGFLVVTSLAVTGIGSGVVAGQAANGSNNTTPTTGQAPLGQLGGGSSNTTSNNTSTNDTSSDLSTPLDAEVQRKQTSPSGTLNGNGIRGSVNESIQGNSSSGGDGGGGGLFGFNIEEDVINPAMNSTKQKMADGFTWMLNQSMETTIGTPVPEDDNDDGIVMVPTNEPWDGLYHNYFVPYIFPLAVVLALLGMILECGIMPWRALRSPTYSQTRAFVTFIVTLVAVIFTMPIITVLHQTIDVLATNTAPSAAELTESTKGIMNLSGGAIAGILAAYGLGFTEALMLAFVYALRYGSLFILPWFLPLLIALAYNAPHDRLSGLASEMIWQYIGILIQAFPVALLFRAAYEMEWDFGLGGLMGVLASGAIFVVAAALPLITSIGMFKAAPSVQSVATGAAGYVAGSRATDYSRQAAGQAARGGYQRMASMKTNVAERIRSLNGSNTPERGQTTINDFEDRTHPRDGVPKRGEL
ncbi:hypothetical protein [Halococcus salsus]|uniref:hypothetical protein n=1 Tax=Halococcus salsus TaxID=2162894 RepID=UPI0013567418|nr:hypothetical protein [Halococcus salsus]